MLIVSLSLPYVARTITCQLSKLFSFQGREMGRGTSLEIKLGPYIVTD